MRPKLPPPIHHSARIATSRQFQSKGRSVCEMQHPRCKPLSAQQKSRLRPMTCVLLRFGVPLSKGQNSPDCTRSETALYFFTRYSTYFVNTASSIPLLMESTIFLRILPSGVTKNVAQPLLSPIQAI